MEAQFHLRVNKSTQDHRRDQCLWWHFCKIFLFIRSDTFNLKCPVSGTKSMLSFIQNRWMWQCFITLVVLCITAKMSGSVTTCLIAFENSVSPVNNNLNLTFRVRKSKCEIKTQFALSTIPFLLASVYNIRKALHMELVIWCKRQNVLVCKSCIMVKEFWGHNMVLCKEPYKNNLLINNLQSCIIATSGHFSRKLQWIERYVLGILQKCKYRHIVYVKK